ncbi:ABC transporter substrate-binding protein [Nitrogeniibacter mangrovi]|uniref:ABC transporter substrate-binding protein n=1 Tax=Nitrogeniibacter mangrovi TaxID=2016596 RepID=A0A6C1B3D8_9RHOO|nr:ABC transporter substrate-binding protein [Nitrogeniibacter mangrovi]QID18172.1 ABC transporter substrate-binding protein [Nitrogeniibacter mangrovi]
MRYDILGRSLLALAASALFSFSAHADPGVTDTSIHLGMSSPFSGPNGEYGITMRTGVEAALAEVNAKGGVNGRKITLTALDDGYETERSVANTHKLIENDKVFALIAYYGSSPTTAAMKVFSAAQVPLVGTISGAGTLRDPVNRYMFNLRASYADETAAIVKHLLGIGITNIAVFYQDDGFGKSGLDGVTRTLAEHDLKPSAVAAIARNATDASAAVKTIAAANPQAVVMVTLLKPTAAFVTAMHAAGQQPQFVTLSPIGADLLVKDMGADKARGIGITQVMPYPWNDALPLVRDYRHAIGVVDKTAEPSYYGLEGYVAGRVMIEALKRINGEPTREKLVAALEQAPIDLKGFRVQFTPDNHSGSRFVELTILGRNGQILR